MNMTVKELIRKLSELPSDATVIILYPNDDQDWAPSIVVKSTEGMELANILLE